MGLFHSLFRLRLDIPALSDLVGFLRELDAREQGKLQLTVDQLTGDLKLTNDQIQNIITKEN